MSSGVDEETSTRTSGVGSGAFAPLLNTPAMVPPVLPVYLARSPCPTSSGGPTRPTTPIVPDNARSGASPLRETLSGTGCIRLVTDPEYITATPGATSRQPPAGHHRGDPGWAPSRRPRPSTTTATPAEHHHGSPGRSHGTPWSTGPHKLGAVEERATVARHHVDAVGPVSGRAAVTFLGAEPIDVLRFGPHPDGYFRYATVGMSAEPMGDPAAAVRDPAGPRAELLLSLRAPRDSVARRLAVL